MTVLADGGDHPQVDERPASPSNPIIELASTGSREANQPNLEDEDQRHGSGLVNSPLEDMDGRAPGGRAAIVSSDLPAGSRPHLPVNGVPFRYATSLLLLVLQPRPET